MDLTPYILGVIVGICLGAANTFAMRWLLKSLKASDANQSTSLAFIFLIKMVLFFAAAWLCLKFIPMSILAFGISIIGWMMFSTFLFQRLEAKGDTQNGA